MAQFVSVLSYMWSSDIIQELNLDRKAATGSDQYEVFSYFSDGT
jgi:hypothetical protein